MNSDDSSDSSSESDNDAFLISKKKKKTKTQKTRQKNELGPYTTVQPGSNQDLKLKSEVDELKSMIFELAKIQKKQNKTTRKHTERKSGGNNVTVNLPPNK